MKYFDTFTGYGGFTLGIQRAFSDLLPEKEAERVREKNQKEVRGRSSERASMQDEGLDVGSSTSQQHSNGRPNRQLDCIGFSEINKYAIQVYQKHFPEQLCELHNRHQATGQAESISGDKPNTPSEPTQRTTTCNCRHKNYGDITKINSTELPDFDLLTGGFPCQAFSIAGKRQGFNDTRGTLFFDIARILKEKRPRNFILENVKGLLSHDNGRTFKTIITTLVELGYCVEWQVLNAKDFGVPQNRERVFIVGHFGGIPERKVFPLGEGNEVNLKQNAQGNDLAHTLQAGGDKHRGSYIADNPSDVLQGLPNKRAAIRRLTPTECERLMGLPDDWTEGQSDTQRYKLCGNGVVVNVVEAVVRKLYGL